MKRIIIGAAMLCMAGCATASLPVDATPAQKLEAVCKDAKDGIATGEIGLSLAATPEQVTYWQRWIEGAKKVLALKCGA